MALAGLIARMAVAEQAADKSGYKYQDGHGEHTSWNDKAHNQNRAENVTLLGVINIRSLI